jgi:uncharacterized membrane protein
MTAFIYSTLEKIGYTHPLHPAVVHFPIGMAMAALLFVILSSYFRKTELAPAAYYSHIFGLVTVLPSLLLGYMDWQHFFGGEVSALFIAKIVMGLTLLAAICAALLVGRKGNVGDKRFLWLSVACVVLTIAIGYCGGEIQYGSS